MFVEAVRRESDRARREDRRFAVLLLALDHFKDINDTLGRAAGDELLRAVATRLRSSVRKSDMVSRFGGDEFAALATDVHGAGEAMAVAEKLLKALHAPFTINGDRVSTGASIGIALYAGDGADAEVLMSHADVALHRAKAEERGAHRFFTRSMDAETRQRAKLIGELREAVNSEQFFLVYQPQVHIESGAITGLEALLPWRHPLRGVIGPGEFIREAESSGLIIPLGEWVLRAACRQAKSWHEAGILPAAVAVNLSVAQLRGPVAFDRVVAATLAESDLPAERLEIELTESLFMSGEGHQDAVARLRLLGVKLALDDFGTGYSCLAYLRRFPADRVKIARNFVSSLESREDGAVIRATIGLCRELGMRVIAEGVETERQRQLLSAWGCAEAQGFYFARPCTAEYVTSLLRAGKIANASTLELAAAGSSQPGVLLG